MDDYHIVTQLVDLGPRILKLDKKLPGGFNLLEELSFVTLTLNRGEYVFLLFNCFMCNIVKE